MTEARFVRAEDPVAVAAARLAEAVAALARADGRVRLAVPGGSALAALGPARKALGADWSRVYLTWVDERCVPDASSESNRGVAYRCGALERSDPPAQELPLFCDGETPGEAVARVERELRGEFQDTVDVLLLGMGEDGHIASLFPDRPLPQGRTVAYVAESPKPPPQRITLTREVLATARRSVLLAIGESKRRALTRLLQGDPRLPAQGLRGLTVVSDLALSPE